MTVNVVLVDDHRVIRQGVRALLDLEPWLAVVGEAGDGRSGVQMCHDLAPHVVIMDVKMTDISGVEATQQILASHQGVKIIALSAMADSHSASEMLRAGASGYVLKDSVFEDLVAAIRAVMDGHVYLSPRVQSVAV